MCAVADSVTPFPGKLVGPGIRIDPDEMLELHKGRYERMVLVGIEPGGTDPIVSSTAGLFETNTLLDMAKLRLLLGD